MPALRSLLLLVIVLLGAFAVNMGAVPPPGYTTRIWQTEDGLPQNSVTAIVQGQDGYLWIGTYGGLARFDGVRFRTYDPGNTPELADGRIVCLYEDARQILWIGHDSGLITRRVAGRFESVEVDSPYRTERVVAISADRAGEIWILRENGALERITGRRMVMPRLRPTRPQVLSLVRTRDGTLYTDQDGSIYRIRETGAEPLPVPTTNPTPFALGIGSARDGGIWIARGSSLERWADDGVRERLDAAAWGTAASIGVMLETHAGALVVGTIDRGLFITERGRDPVRLDHGDGLTQDWIRAACEDREGNLWVGAGSGGLVEIVSTPISVIAPPDGWGGRTELPVAVDDAGALWVGTEGAGLYRLERGVWKHFGGAEGLAHDFVWSIADAGHGRLYVGTWGGGIFRRRGERFARVSEYDPDAGPVLGLKYEADRRELWIAGASGVLRWPDGGRPRTVAAAGDTLHVCTFVRDAAGALWFGGPVVGLGRIQDGKITRFHARDGLGSDTVLCLKADRDGTLWIGTGSGGLVRYKHEKFARIRTENGLPSNVICYIAEDTFGYFWMSTHRGIVRVARAELEKCADGSVTTLAIQAFDRNDGLPTIEFSAGLEAAGCTSPDGRIWFTSGKGVVAVDPAKIRANRVPPPVVLEAVQVDGQWRPLRGSEPLQLTPGHRRIEFSYTALSLTAPGKVRFKYRLDGIDEAWVDAETKRTASYSRLPAGHYVFHVIACNNDGVWNTAGASVACVVLPFWWQRWWIVALASAVVLGLVVWTVRHLTRRRMERRVEALERRHAVERERARIARDIHDDIGATLTRITMLSQCLPREAQTSGAGAVVEQIYDTAREATRALDEIVWAVNPRYDSLEAFATYMGKFAQDYLTVLGIRCRLDVPVKLPEWPLPADVRHNLFLAFKEALNNAVKHAEATEVGISLRMADAAFVLGVCDNGRGIASSSNAASPGRIASGHGLENVRRRMAAIGGTCDITTEPGKGTCVSFRIAGTGGESGGPVASCRAGAASRE